MPMSSMFPLLLLTSPLSVFFFLSSSIELLYNINNPLSPSHDQLSSERHQQCSCPSNRYFIALIGPIVMHYRHSIRPIMKDKKIVPQLFLKDSGRVDKIESFSQYVARQMGFADVRECPRMCKLAEDYLKKPKGFEVIMYELLENDPEAELLCSNLRDEFDRCILAYFAFHWSQATFVISQVLSLDSEPKRKFKTIVMAATRKQRFERVTKDLKVTRLFSTLVEELKAIGTVPDKDDSKCTEVMVPAGHCQRSPVLLLMGGGMGAGKSTVLKDILKDSFWSEVAKNAVMIEADAFKETDVIYKALSSQSHHDMLQTAELVHQSSTDAASSLLVTALNEGRDVIMDGTLSWEPFVYQTIAMARNIHQHIYRMGVGYKVAEDGTITENYWEQVQDEEKRKGGTTEEYEHQINKKKKRRKAYRIELIGVVCDAHLAVVRGMRRAILMGRAVRVKSQLLSHRRFANAFPKYCELVDTAKLYCTNNISSPPKLIGWKEGDNSLVVDPLQINCLKIIRMLNEDADSIYELYQRGNDEYYELGPIWKDVVLSTSRVHIQKELKIAIQKIESLALHRWHEINALIE